MLALLSAAGTRHVFFGLTGSDQGEGRFHPAGGSSNAEFSEIPDKLLFGTRACTECATGSGMSHLSCALRLNVEFCLLVDLSLESPLSEAGIWEPGLSSKSATVARSCSVPGSTLSISGVRQHDCARPCSGRWSIPSNGLVCPTSERQ
jgi:hypothetical protein